MNRTKVTFLNILFAAALWLLATGCTGCRDEKPPAPSEHSAAITAETVSCPVCGLTFSASDAATKTTYKGKTYYFFLLDHQKAFTLTPDTYLNPDPTPIPLSADSESMEDTLNEIR